MPTDATFRYSTYATLALACAVLGYAEHELLPEVPVFAALAALALAALAALEGRVAFLSIPAANRLGMAVLIVFLAWAAYRVKREMDTAELSNTNWQMFFVAMCGPLVMMVIVAKVARGEKHVRDFWALHGIALAGVGLGAALAEHPLGFVAVGVYLVAAVWSLSLLHLGVARGSVPPLPGGKGPAPTVVAVSGTPARRRTDFAAAVLWAAVALAVAGPLYLLTPRSAASKADFGKPRIEIGYAADQMVNLNRTGPLRTNSETAFEFTAAEPDGTPKTDVSPSQRWRGKLLYTYAGGEWRQSDPPALTVAPLALRTDPWSPPDLGPGQFTLTFFVPARLRGTFRADPELWAANQQPPLAEITDGGLRGWLPVSDGGFFWDANVRGRGTARRYVQAYRTGADPDAGPAFRFIERDYELALTPLRHNPVARVKEYSDRVLDDAVRAGELPADCRDERSLLPKAQHRDTVARAFTAHLSTTPELRYTTELRRENQRVDPVEDFLFHSKAGHCERFATALVLMLRSQGVPAALVLGFKGCEHDSDGHYTVKQEHAHAWVEALVPVAGTPAGRAYHWRSLDPTPDNSQTADTETRGWVDQASTWAEAWYREYFKEYTPEQRQHALAEIARRLTRPEVFAALAAVAALAVGVRLARRRTRHRVPEEAPESAKWFGELVTLLAARGIVPAPGDTALEFATSAAAALRLRPGCAEVADVPPAWAAAYYQDRFGGEPASDARLAELEAGLTALRQALAR